MDIQAFLMYFVDYLELSHPPPWTLHSFQMNQVCNSLRKIECLVQSCTTTTVTCRKEGRGGRKCGSRVVYEGANDGTVYTGRRVVEISMRDAQ